MSEQGRYDGQSLWLVVGWGLTQSFRIKQMIHLRRVDPNEQGNTIRSLTLWVLFITLFLAASTGHASCLGPVAKHSFPSLAIQVWSRQRTPVRPIIAVLLHMLIIVVLGADEVIARTHRLITLVLPLQRFHHALIGIIRASRLRHVWIDPLIVRASRRRMSLRTRVELRMLGRRRIRRRSDILGLVDPTIFVGVHSWSFGAVGPCVVVIGGAAEVRIVVLVRVGSLAFVWAGGCCLRLLAARSPRVAADVPIFGFLPIFWPLMIGRGRLRHGQINRCR